MELPPDRGHLATEQRHPGSAQFDALAVADAVALVADDQAAAVNAVRAARARIAAFIDDLVPRMRSGGRLVYVGAGTSGRLGVLDAAECPPTFHSDPAQVVGIIAGGDASLRSSSEGREDDRDGAADALAEIGLGPGDTLLAVAAGGTTPYVLGAIDLAAAAGARTGLLACAEPRPRPRCDHLIVLETGPELIAGSTRLKAGTATKIVLNTITTIAFARLGKVYGNLMVDLRATNAKLADRAIRILRELCPEVSREDAASALARAGGRLPVAIVMTAHGVDASDARALLDGHGGSLRAALGA
jgi:N-acetylmuramic acid 6-phosphate etherase